MTSKTDLIIHCLTCTNDAHGLFDFESKSLIKQTFKLRSKDEDFRWAMYMLNSKIHLIESSLIDNFTLDNPSAYEILRVSYNSNEFQVQSPQNINNEMESSTPESNIIWVVHSDVIMKRFNCKNRKSLSTHSLTENDILKFGRIELSVKCIIMGAGITASDLNLKGLGFISPDKQSTNVCNYFEDMHESYHILDTQRASDCVSDDGADIDISNFDMVQDGNINSVDADSETCMANSGVTVNNTENVSNSENFGKLKSLVSTTTPLCRICLCGESDPGPLVTPCNCKGSLNYVHLECLRTWIKGRLSIVKDDDASFFWKELSCELCGKPYPSVLQVDDTETNLMDIKKPDAPYVVLEMRSNSGDGCFVVSVAKNKAIIGRGHESDVRLSDISVSRMHASLELDGGKVVIHDQQSKFGTLVRAKAPFSMPIKGPICLQIGRSILLISIKDVWSLKWPSCMRADLSQESNIVDLEPVTLVDP